MTRPTDDQIAVSERLPEPGIKVLAHYFNACRKDRTVCATWIPAKFRTDDVDTDDNDFLEYDEESDEYYWPEGWYEEIDNWDELQSVRIHEGVVDYWRPLPHWAIPLPEGSTMTQLSPAVRAVQAAMPEILDMEDSDQLAAKIIRALVEQKLPEEAKPADPDLTLRGAGIREGRWIERQCLRAEFLAVAAELEGKS